MNSIPGLYFILVGPDQARFVRPDTEGGLHTVGSVKLMTFCNHAGPGDPYDHARSEQTTFLALLASRIGEDLAADLFTHLVLVAPPDVLTELMDLLDAPTTAGLLGMLARDLMPVPDLELWPYLLPWIQWSIPSHAPPVSLDH